MLFRSLKIIPDSPNQPELAVTGRDQPRLETVWPDAAGSFGAEVGGWALQHLGMQLMPWQQRVLDGQLLFDGDQDFLHRMSMVSTARQNGKTVPHPAFRPDACEAAPRDCAPIQPSRASSRH